MCEGTYSRFDGLSSVPGVYMMERTNSWKLSSNIHSCTMAHKLMLHMHEFMHSCIHTLKMLLIFSILTHGKWRLHIWISLIVSVVSHIHLLQASSMSSPCLCALKTPLWSKYRSVTSVLHCHSPPCLPSDPKQWLIAYCRSYAHT